MLEDARLGGRVFYTTVEHHHCSGSHYILGFRVSPGFVANWSSGEWQASRFPDSGRSIWKTPAARCRAIPDFAMVPTGSVKYISFGPLGEATFINEMGGIVVTVICTPKQGLYLSRMATWATGGSVHGTPGPAPAPLFLPARW